MPFGFWFRGQPNLPVPDVYVVSSSPLSGMHVVSTACLPDVLLVQGVRKVMPYLKVKIIFRTLSANIINEPQPGYCVHIELYTCTVSSGWARFSLVSIEHYRWKPMQINESYYIFRTPCITASVQDIYAAEALAILFKMPDRLFRLDTTSTHCYVCLYVHIWKFVHFPGHTLKGQTDGKFNFEGWIFVYSWDTCYIFRISKYNILMKK